MRIDRASSKSAAVPEASWRLKPVGTTHEAQPCRAWRLLPGTPRCAAPGSACRSKRLGSLAASCWSTNAAGPDCSRNVVRSDPARNAAAALHRAQRVMESLTVQPQGFCAARQNRPSRAARGPGRRRPHGSAAYNARPRKSSPTSEMQLKAEPKHPRRWQAATHPAQLGPPHLPNRFETSSFITPSTRRIAVFDTESPQLTAKDLARTRPENTVWPQCNHPPSGCASYMPNSASVIGLSKKKPLPSLLVAPERCTRLAALGESPRWLCHRCPLPRADCRSWFALRRVLGKIFARPFAS